MVSKNNSSITVVLGSEFDNELRENLFRTLSVLGAKKLRDCSKFVAGSQELEEISVEIGNYTVLVESETYIGLSISGEEKIILKIKELLTGS